MKPLLARIACACTLAGCHAPVAPADAASAPDVAADSGGDVSAPADTTAVAALDVVPDADIAATPTAIPLNNFIQAYAKRQCELIVTCWPGAVRDATWLATCAGDLGDLRGRALLGPLLNRLRLAELGRLDYDGVAAAECLAAESCATAGNLMRNWLGGMHIPRPGQVAVAGPCGKIFSGGKVALGTACDDDAECATGRCWGCPGICRAPVALGAACGSDAPCPDDGVCEGTPSNGHVCAPVTALPIGATCSDVWACDAFYPSCATCDAAGGWCSPAGVCAGPLPAGAACSWPEPCAAGLTCVNGICAAPLPDGATCATSTDCDANANECYPAWGGESVGEHVYKCWHDPNSVPCGATGCPIGTYCFNGTGAGKCAPNRKVGAPCTPGIDACDLSFCSLDTNKCTAYKPCAASSCAVALCNADGSCPNRRLGDACSEDSECSDYQLLFNGVCFGGVCRAGGPACSLPAAGTP